MIVVWNAELAQSYIAHARSSRRPSPRRVEETFMQRASSEGPPRDPLAQQRIDDDVAVALAREDVVAHERGERRLDASTRRPADDARGRRPTAARGRPRARRRAARRAAPASAAATSPRTASSCSPSSRRSVACRSSRSDPPSAVRPHIVPGLVREPLDVVRQVAGELDDRLRRGPARGLDAARLEPRVDERGEPIGRNLLRAASPVRPCRTAGCGPSIRSISSARSRRRRSRPAR